MSTPKLVGAHLWIDWRLGGPIKDRLWEFMGTGIVRGEISYQFIPYKRRGYPLVVTHTQAMNDSQFFKPFLITPEDFIGASNGA